MSNKTADKKAQVSQHSYWMFFKFYFMIAITAIIIHAHDQWINICNLSHEYYCKYLCYMAQRRAKNVKNCRLLFAYLDPPHESTAERTVVPLDITDAVHAYYAVDTILSCFTLQEWLTRFNIKAEFVNLIYVRSTCIYHSRLDLTRDIETQTSAAADMNFLEMPGRIINNNSPISNLHSD